jgi:hypothetical protein
MLSRAAKVAAMNPALLNKETWFSISYYPSIEFDFDAFTA